MGGGAISTSCTGRKSVNAGSETLLAPRGVEQLPNPPIAMPDWLEGTQR